jgi:hypothetical protein
LDSPSAGAGTETKETPMDTTPQPLAPDLQASLRHLRRIVLGGAVALALLGATAGFAAPAHASTGKVSYSDLPRKVNEYEGQHRLAAAGDPSQWGLTSGKDPEIPSTPGVATGKDPEVPVTSS